MYRQTILDNGLTILTEHLPEFRSVSLGLWVGAGSRFETPAQAGLTHFIEHLLFKGTEKRSAYDIAATMDGIGGQMNAFTEKEHTCYYARVMDTHLQMALEVLCDMFLNSVFDPEELEREKGVVIEEIKMYEDTPDDHIYDLFTAQLLAEHELGRPIIGYVPTVSSFKRADIRSYVDFHYRAQNVIVAAAGRVDHDTFVEWVKGHLADNLPAGKPENQVRPAEAHSSKKVFYKDSEQAYVCFGGSGLSYVDPRRYTMLALDVILGGSMSSRLFQEIREKRGLAYSVGTFQNSFRDCGVLGIYAGTGKDKVGEVLDVSRTILREVCKNGLTEEELRRAKELLKGSIAMGLESTSNRMMRMARNWIYHGRFISIEEAFAKFEAVTLEDVLALASEKLNPDKFSLTVLGPVDEVDGVRSVPLKTSSQQTGAGV